MFEPQKAKLTATEAAARTAITTSKAEITRVEVEIQGLGKAAAAPLDRLEADAQRAEQEISQKMASLRTRAKQLAPPAG